MLDRPLMLRVNVPVFDTAIPQFKFVFTGVKIKAIGDSKRNGSLTL